MNHATSRFSRQASWAGTAAIAGLLACLVAPASAADKSRDSVEQRYQRERADCLAGRTNQTRATCLQEAGAARAEGRRQGLTSPDADFVRNQRQRCEALPPADRQACIARMSGEGTTRGSVAEGGVLRELTTRSTGTAPAASSAASGATR